MSNTSGGWIYILLSSADYARSKIGKTRNNPLVRFRQLRTGDPCLGLVVAYYIPEDFGPIGKYEAKIHLEFQGIRIDTHEESESEWFRIESWRAEEIIDGMLGRWCGQSIYYADTFNPEKITKMYESAIQALFEPDQHQIENDQIPLR